MSRLGSGKEAKDRKEMDSQCTVIVWKPQKTNKYNSDTHSPITPASQCSNWLELIYSRVQPIKIQLEKVLLLSLCTKDWK